MPLPQPTDTKPITYDFVFGYSTGHVGTTAMSDGTAYGHPSHVVFMHELKNGPYNFPKSAKFTTAVWKKGNSHTEYKFVRNTYVDFLKESRGENKTTLVDLGHNNLYFVNALVKYLLSQTTYRFLIVRVRRERYESAVSLSFDRPGRRHEDLCSALWFRYCPYDREEDVILHPPSRHAWLNFTTFQKALWLVDETEARWHRLVTENPCMNYTEVIWGSKWPHSFENATLTIARFLGLHLSHMVTSKESENRKKNNIHAGKENQDIYSHQIAIEDLEYKKIMRATVLTDSIRNPTNNTTDVVKNNFISNLGYFFLI